MNTANARANAAGMTADQRALHELDLEARRLARRVELILEQRASCRAQELDGDPGEVTRVTAAIAEIRAEKRRASLAGSPPREEHETRRAREDYAPRVMRVWRGGGR